MSTVLCPSCGSEYVATVERCSDCGVSLLEPSGAVLAPDEGDMGYELEDWTVDQRAELGVALAAEGRPFRWEGPEIIVADTDAELVENLIDTIDHPDALDLVDDDGDDGSAEVLSALFLAADILGGDPTSGAAVIDAIDAADAAEATNAPYGVDGATWAEVRRRASALADLLGEQANDEDVVAAAQALRQVVRPLV